MNPQNEKDNISHLRNNIFNLIEHVENHVKSLSKSNVDNFKIMHSRFIADLKDIFKKEEVVIEFLIKNIDDLYKTNNDLKQEVEKNGEDILRIHNYFKNSTIF
jgi:hypothetical protein